MVKIKGVFLIILSAVILSGCTKSQRSLSNLTFTDHQLIEIQLGNSPLLKLEVVNTPQSITQGLSGRKELGVDGMLFVFDQPTTPQFWMKEMNFDLDIIWINQQKIVEIIKDVPAPVLNTPFNELPIYSPKQPVNMILETEAGKAAEWQLSIGDLVFTE